MKKTQRVISVLTRPTEGSPVQRRAPRGMKGARGKLWSRAVEVVLALSRTVGLGGWHGDQQEMSFPAIERIRRRGSRGKVQTLHQATGQ